MRSANLFGPLKGLCPHKALIGLTQASGLAGGFDFTTIRLADFPLFTIRHYLPIPFGVISMNRYYYLVGAYAPLDLMVTIACLVR